MLFSLVGSTPVVRAQRRVIYEVLARRLSPEHRLATTAKITQEVLGAVVDETLPFAACAEVVHDALVVVGMKEMKVCMLAPNGVLVPAVRPVRRRRVTLQAVLIRLLTQPGGDEYSEARMCYGYPPGYVTQRRWRARSNVARRLESHLCACPDTEG